MERLGTLWQGWIWTQMGLTAQLVLLPSERSWAGADFSCTNSKVSLSKASTAIWLQRGGPGDV